MKFLTEDSGILGYEAVSLSEEDPESSAAML
jgi:hypothetical protein